MDGGQLNIPEIHKFSFPDALLESRDGITCPASLSDNGSDDTAEILRLRSVSSRTSQPLKPASCTQQYGPDPLFFAKIQDQSRHFNGPNGHLPYVSPFVDVAPSKNVYTERVSRIKKIATGARALVAKTVEFVGRRKLKVAAYIGALAAAGGLVFMANQDFGHTTAATFQDKQPAPSVPSTLAIQHEPEHSSALLSPTGGSGDVYKSNADEVSIGTSEIVISPNGNISWALKDWLIGQGAYDQDAIDAEIPSLVKVIEVQNPDLDTNLVFSGQQIPLPQEAYFSLANIFAAQAAA